MTYITPNELAGNAGGADPQWRCDRANFVHIVEAKSWRVCSATQARLQLANILHASCFEYNHDSQHKAERSLIHRIHKLLQ
jgi:hypothetical protein